jgi:hypothetical protein
MASVSLVTNGDRRSISLGHHQALERIKSGHKRLLIGGEWATRSLEDPFRSSTPPPRSAGHGCRG